jgi:hypothetical protein
MKRAQLTKLTKWWHYGVHARANVGLPMLRQFRQPVVRVLAASQDRPALVP